MKIDHKFIPRSDTERIIVAAIENGAQILCGVLNLNVTLSVERMNGWGSADAFHQGKWVNNENLIKINLRNLYGASLDYILEVLGHEFRHAVQSVYKVCDDVPLEVLHPTQAGIHIWGRTFNSYWNKPKERDARKYQRVYRDIIVNHSKFAYRDQLEEIVPGELPLIPDRVATIERLGRPSQFIMVFRDRDRKEYWFDYRDVSGTSKKDIGKHKKLWTQLVCRRVWTEYRVQLMNQPFELIYRMATADDMIY